MFAFECKLSSAERWSFWSLTWNSSGSTLMIESKQSESLACSSITAAEKLRPKQSLRKNWQPRMLFVLRWHPPFPDDDDDFVCIKTTWITPETKFSLNQLSFQELNWFDDTFERLLVVSKDSRSYVESETTSLVSGRVHH